MMFLVVQMSFLQKDPVHRAPSIANSYLFMAVATTNLFSVSFFFVVATDEM